ncbi:MAG: hypothetical protein JWP97_4400 [Labilithrix sp.]|nr:hypothetical protein [Labilithrix sp.]
MKRLLAACVALAALAGCNTLQGAAKNDPMKCERDAKCDKKRTRTADCSTQCVDDPACMDRCGQIQQQNGGLGH